MAELLEDIGHNIRRLREQKGWNQTELGFHANASPSIISLIENGKRNPSTTTLAKIAGAMGVEVVDFFPKKAQVPLWRTEGEWEQQSE
jgi:transcriptional regulator with XRE-family HTH domain